MTFENKAETWEKQKILLDKIINKYNNGLGIGLTIVRHNLKILGSSLEFSSQENGGSKFFFTISFKKVNKKKRLYDIGQFQGRFVYLCETLRLFFLHPV